MRETIFIPAPRPDVIGQRLRAGIVVHRQSEAVGDAHGIERISGQRGIGDRHRRGCGRENGDVTLASFHDGRG